MENSVILARKKFTAENFVSQVKLSAPSAVKRVLSTNAKSFISKAESVSKTLSLSGKVTVNVVYLSDLNTVESASAELEFIEKQQCEFDLENLFAVDSVRVDGVSSTSSEIMVTLLHSVRVSGTFGYSVASFDGEQSDFVTQTSSLSAHRLVSFAEDSFVVAEEVESNIKDMQVLSSNANVQALEVKCGVDKVVVEGKIVSELFESDGETYGLVTKQFEFKQEIQANSVSPEMIAEATVLVKNVRVTPEAKGDKTTLVYAFDLAAAAYVYEEHSYDLVTDMFSLNCNLSTKSNFVEAKTFESLSECKESFLTSTDISSIEGFDDLLGVFNASFECESATCNQSELCVEGKICADALILVSGEIKRLAVESHISFAAKTQEGLLCSLREVGVEILSYKVKAGKELEVNFELNFSLLNEGELCADFIESYELGERKSEDAFGVRVYVTGSGETLFDVARALNVRPEEIERQNDIQSGFESGKKIYVYSPINLI